MSNLIWQQIILAFTVAIMGFGLGILWEWKRRVVIFLGIISFFLIIILSLIVLLSPFNPNEANPIQWGALIGGMLSVFTFNKGKEFYKKYIYQS